jgi:hypothetical protein
LTCQNGPSRQARPLGTGCASLECHGLSSVQGGFDTHLNDVATLAQSANGPIRPSGVDEQAPVKSKMKAPEDLNLSPEEGDALIERIEHDTCTPEDRLILVHVLRLYFWLLFALQESKLSLKRLRIILFGKPKNKKRRQPVSDADGDSATSGDGENSGGLEGQPGELAESATAEPSETGETGGESGEGDNRPGHGRLGADAYVVTRSSPLAIAAPFVARAPCTSCRQAGPFASTAMPCSRPFAMS